MSGHDNVLEEVKMKINLLDYILRTCGGKVSLKSNGLTRINPCPICGKKDHFHVKEDTNSYSSFNGCCRGGTIIDFLIEKEGLNKNEAIKKAKELTGINVSINHKAASSPDNISSINAKELENNDFTILIDEVHKKVNETDYFKNRGFTKTIEEYKLGYHPEGLNYAITSAKGLLQEKSNDLYKTYKYFIPCINKEGICDYFITRRDDTVPLPSWVTNQTKSIKTHNLKGQSPIPFNVRYLQDPSLSKEYLFILEGWADALSVEEIGYHGIAIHSAANVKTVLKEAEKNKDILTEKIFIIVGDPDEAGQIMNSKLEKGFKNIGLKYDTYIIPKYHDFNEWLVENKAEFAKCLSDYTSELKEKILSTKPQEIEFGNSVFERDNCYFKTMKEGSKVISNFIIEPLELVESDKVSELKAKLYTNSGNKLQRHFTMDDFNSTAKFKKSLNSIDLSYTGKDDDLEYIKAKISRKTFERKKGVSSIGFHYINGKWVFAGSNKTIGEDLDEVNDIVMLESYKELDTDLLEYSPITKEELLRIAKPLFKFNDLKKVATVLGYAASIFLKEKLWRSGIKFNHLLIIGEAGSGKSQTVESVITPLLGLKTSPVGAAKCTPFSTMRTASSSNTIPLVIEEYKPAQIGVQRVKDISNLLRDVYDHHRGQRGKADQTIEYYDLCSPVILVGEMGTDETAIKERSLQVIFSKLDIEDSSRRMFFKVLKDNQDLLKKLGRSLLNTSLRMSETDIKQLHEACLNTVNSSITAPRVKNSIANSMIGIGLLNQVFKDLDLDIKELTGLNNKDIIEAINAAAFEDLLDSNNNSRTVVDITLEVFARMADAGKLSEDIDYIKVNGEELALHINRFYDRYNKYRAECKLDDEYLAQKQFTSQLRRTSYFLEYKPAKLYTDYEKTCKKPYKCYVLSIKKLIEKNLELEPLIGSVDDTDGLTECSDSEIPF